MFAGSRHSECIAAALQPTHICLNLSEMQSSKMGLHREPTWHSQAERLQNEFGTHRAVYVLGMPRKSYIRTYWLCESRQAAVSNQTTKNHMARFGDDLHTCKYLYMCIYIYMYIRVHKCIYAYTHTRMAYTPSAMTPAVHNHRVNFSHAGSKLCQPVLVVQIYSCSLKASRKGTDVGPSPGIEHSRATLAQQQTPSPQNERHSRR